MQWLGKTILARLVTEMDEVNAMLVHAGSDDIQIGGLTCHSSFCHQAIEKHRETMLLRLGLCLILDHLGFFL